MTREEAILKGFYCKTEICNASGQWFYTDQEGYTTIDYFTKEIVSGRRVHPNFIYDEEKEKYIFPIVLNSCKGHNRLGVGNYSDFR